MDCRIREDNERTRLCATHDSGAPPSVYLSALPSAIGPLGTSCLYSSPARLDVSGGLSSSRRNVLARSAPLQRAEDDAPLVECVVAHAAACNDRKDSERTRLFIASVVRRYRQLRQLWSLGQLACAPCPWIIHHTDEVLPFQTICSETCQRALLQEAGYVPSFRAAGMLGLAVGALLQSAGEGEGRMQNGEHTPALFVAVQVRTSDS